MSVCINKNSVEYQSLKNKAGIPEFILEAVSRDFMEKYGRLPHLDELPNSNSEPYLRDQLGVTKYNSAKVKSILEMTGKETIEEAVIDINNQFRDLETTIVPINKEALVDIVHRPTDNNFDNWTEEDQILAEAPRDNNGNLLAPNGKVSNLTEKQYAQVRTKAFKKWFGDWQNNPAEASKVVDENGEPKVMYHGTPWGKFNEFRHFSPNTGDRTPSGHLYFSASKSWAETYTRGEFNKGTNSPTLYEVFLNLRNPFNYKNPIKNKKDFINELSKYWEILPEDVYDAISKTATEDYNLSEKISPYYSEYIYRAIADYYKNNNDLEGFNIILKKLANGNFNDGIIWFLRNENSLSDVKFDGTKRQVVVFNPNQIKPATSNSGSFNKLSGNIYDEEPNGYLILNNALQKLASLHGITFNETSDAELNSEKWQGIIPDASLVNAFIYNGQIYINLDRANLDAPIHEMFHMFVGSLRFTNPSLYQALVDSTQSFPNYEQLVQEYPGRTRNDVNEEILVTEVSKYLVGQPSSLASMNSATRYEISYNIKRMLDTILMGQDSVKTISEDRLFNLSLKEIAKEVSSAVITNNFSGTFNVEGSELHRKLNNIKSDLYKEGTLEEYCD